MSRRTVLAALGSSALVAAAVGSAGRAGADAGDAARVELGRRLFFDPAIGRQGRVACAACHDPEHGFSDARPTSPDETRTLPRHSQPLVDLDGRGFHWDGEFDTVRDVIDARTLPAASAAKASALRSIGRLTALKAAGAPLDAGAVKATVRSLGAGGTYGDGGEDPGADVEAVVSNRIARDGRYAAGFAAAFGDPSATPQRVGDALEAYVVSLRSSAAPIDRFLAGDATAIDESARRGLDLFRGKAGCVQCHVADGERAAFTDRQWHDTGVAARPQILEGAARSVPGGVLISVDGVRFVEGTDLGRAAATFVAADRAAYKTPSLRDVGRRAPYFHDASAKTLEEVVRYYAKGGTPHDGLDAKIQPLSLEDADVADLVAFLESLTGDVRPGLGPVDAGAPRRVTVRVQDPDGRPATGRVVVVRPFGDRLAGTSTMPAPFETATGADGVAVFDAPLSTHFVVEAAGLPPTAPLPDWTSSVRLLEVPRTSAVARVVFPDGAAIPDQFFAYEGDLFAARPRLTFKRVRDLGTAEVLYAAPAGAQASGAAEFITSLRTSGAMSLDLRPGAQNVIDLRTAQAPRDEASGEELRKLVTQISSFLRKRK